MMPELGTTVAFKVNGRDISGKWTRSRNAGWQFNSIKNGTEKRPEKGTETEFATSICMNSEEEPGLYRFGPVFTKEISILIQ